MQFSEDSEIAANYLRQAVPTMVKHKIVPNPLNYTLWYSYYTNKLPKLNEELDRAIDYYGTLPPRVGESLFVQHFKQEEDKSSQQLESMHQAFSTVVTSLSNSIDDTTKQSNDFSKALKNNLNSLDEYTLEDSLKSVVNDLSNNASAICDNNAVFSSKLESAQLEINALKRELAATREEANTDPLTTLSNRRVFETIYNEFVVANAEEDNLSLIIMDIDKFKVFNDTHGHLMGDQILKYVGKLLKKECPESITPVRFGGEEFALICPQVDTATAIAFAEKIREKLAGTPLKNTQTGEKIPPVTASFGVALRESGDELNMLIERADQALYQAKSAGRNKVVCA